MENTMRMYPAARCDVISRGLMVYRDTFGTIFKLNTSTPCLRPYLFGLLAPSSLFFLANSSQDFTLWEGLDGE